MRNNEKKIKFAIRTIRYIDARDGQKKVRSFKGSSCIEAVRKLEKFRQNIWVKEVFDPSLCGFTYEYDN